MQSRAIKVALALAIKSDCFTMRTKFLTFFVNENNRVKHNTNNY